jgi:hypothetical protein
MRQDVKLVKLCDEASQTVAGAPLPQPELKHYQHVIGSVAQDALNTWAEIWGELRQGVYTGVTVVHRADEGAAVSKTESAAGEPFKPSCGWPEFLEKMWRLRNYLDFVARISRQR